MKVKRNYQYTVFGAQERTFGEVLTADYGYSSRLLRRIKAEGEMMLNGKDCWLCSRVGEGDQIEIRLPAEAVDSEPTPHPIEIIYEDDEVLVINKDAAVVTHPTKRHQTDTLSNFVAAYYQTTRQSAKIRFVNRIDMDTTGIVVIAKNKYVHHYLQSGKTHEKTYLAFAHGRFAERRGTIAAPIGRVDAETIYRQVTDDGKPCVTHYEVLEQYAEAALVRLRLEPGRTHQIRVHLQHIGHPLIGDTMYGDESRLNYNMTRQALHAAEMVLTLPTGGKHRFRADFKQDMIVLRQALSCRII